MNQPLPFSLPATLVLLAIAAIAVASCVALTSRRKLTMTYTLVWSFAFGAFSLLITVPHLLNRIAAVLSSSSPDGAIRLLAFVTIVGFLIFFSVKVSELTHRLEDLAQQAALRDLAHRERIAVLEAERAAPPRTFAPPRPTV